VPYLVRWQGGGQVRRTSETGEVDTGIEHGYSVEMSNESSWMKFGRFIGPFIQCCVNTKFTREGYEQNWILTLTDLLGYRYVYFEASVVSLDGKVSKISYGIADRLGFPRLAAEIVSVKSAHSFWAPYRSGFEVSSTDDESPQFRVVGTAHNLDVSYTYDAPHNMTAHAFQVNLSCFWGLRGCHHVRQIVPLLWQDKNAIEAATLVRLQSQNPCPDRILSGRVQYLPDAGILLLESKGVKAGSLTRAGQRVEGNVIEYKALEALRGGLSIDLESAWGTDTVPFPGDYTRRIPNKGLRWAKAGERVLAFSNLRFDSCRIIPATSTALSAIKNAAPAPRRIEDQSVWGLQ